MARNKANTLSLDLEEAAVHYEESLRPQACTGGGDLGELLAIDSSCGGDLDADGVAIEGGDEVDFAAVIDSKVRNV